jgi:hypothetical protein
MPAGSGREARLREAEDILSRQDQVLVPVFHYSNLNMIEANKWGGWTNAILDCHPPKYIYQKRLGGLDSKVMHLER